MKKYIPLVFLLTLILLFSGNTIAEENVLNLNENNHEMMVGLDLPSVGWAQYNDSGLLTGYRGINLLVGYSAKNYMNPGIKNEHFNTFWGWGTYGLINPYVELGADYPFAVEESSGNYWSVGGSIGAFAPLVSIEEVNFDYPVFPTANISVSYRF
ncbi:MAG: hypothetical protein ACOC21_03535 [Halanaerobiales bacterium]